MYLMCTNIVHVCYFFIVFDIYYLCYVLQERCMYVIGMDMHTVLPIVIIDMLRTYILTEFWGLLMVSKYDMYMAIMKC